MGPIDLTKIIGQAVDRVFSGEFERKEGEDTLGLSFSSEVPVERWYGYEILDHSPEAVVLDRLNDGAPVLLDHNREMQVGVIEKAWVDEGARRGKAVIRFSRVGRGPEVRTDVEDGIKRKTSVGYIVHDAVEAGKVNDVPVIRVTRWEPMEVSIVSVPADVTVGVGRSATSQTSSTSKEEGRAMPPEITNGPTPEQIEQIRAEGKKAETLRVSEIEAASAKFVGRVENLDDLRTQAVKENWTADRFMGEIALRITDGRPIDTPKSEVGMTAKEIKEYSLARAIRHRLDPRFPADLEMEVHRQLEKQMGNATHGGILLPWDIQKEDSRSMFDDPMYRQFFQKRDLLTTSNASAGYLVETSLLAGSFIEILRNRALCFNLGVRMLPGLVGKIAIPRQTGSATALWATEGTAVGTESTQTFDQVSLTPKEVAAFTDISRKMLMTSTPAVEGLVRSDLAATLALAIDAGVLNGGGTLEPTGILNTSGIGSVTGTSLAFAGVVEFETDVAAANADVSTMAYVTTPAIYGLLKTRVKETNFPFYLLENGMLNGYPAYRTNQMPTAKMVFGNFAEAFVGMWGGLEILVNPYRQDIEGLVRISAWQSVDVGVRHAGSFSAAASIT
jgi:HK97 family phage major capsid protein